MITFYVCALIPSATARVVLPCRQLYRQFLGLLLIDIQSRTKK